MGRPLIDSRFVELTDGPLIDKLESYARTRGITPDEFVQKTLQSCEELGILASASSPDTLPASWGGTGE